ncbi:MAG: LuxR C-terminal-related transcriptional regulator, partial [Bacteroides sp.]|nr:LuxR C-terminal-related transcriptional regulator [Bacteroides sp.]
IYIDHELRQEDLDYEKVKHYFAEFDRMSELSGNCFFIVDLYTFEYLYTSPNFQVLVGYLPAPGGDNREAIWLDAFIHPEDFVHYTEIMYRVGEFILSLPVQERPYFRHIFEFRIRNVQGEYIWVSWEWQSLETDSRGNLWLMLGILNILPNQEREQGVKSSFIDLRTGERILLSPVSVPFSLSSQELKILRMIQQGLLSKEIASKLSISVNTVNIHRQNILRKMEADNSLEAVNKACSVGLLS